MDKQLLDILVCPICKGKLHYVQEAKELICRFHRLAYAIKDGIPVMIAEEARTLSLQEEAPKT
ncbi:tetraacyldisaccharide 4'-kinase [Achromatium sp. WMS1]|nr:tetraacyldisaccharide 4'-kinase [Achromatium sp. WMS1]